MDQFPSFAGKIKEMLSPNIVVIHIHFPDMAHVQRRIFLGMRFSWSDTAFCRFSSCVVTYFLTSGVC